MVMENLVEKAQNHSGFEERLETLLLKVCGDKKALDGQLLQVEELQEKWNEIAPQYMADSMPQFNDYPLAAIAWAGFLGMGSAVVWDCAWDQYKVRTDFYESFVSARGFDCMDEYVMEEVLGLKEGSKECEDLQNLMLSCAQVAFRMMKSEGVESGTKEAFYLFASTAKIFFKLGVSLELKQLGYSYKKYTVPMPQELMN